MKYSKEDLGVVTALLERFTKQRLPRMLEIKERVDKGEKIEDQDLEFLQMIHDDALKNEKLMETFPQLKDFVVKAISLYTEITNKALENEKND
jgi:hypothetical protein